MVSSKPLELESEERRLRATDKEKEALFADNKEEQQGLSAPTLVAVFSTFFIVLFLFVPKIYLSNNIYYMSRSIQKLQSQEEILQEEKNRLQLELEKQRYKYSIENMQ
ncbi:hypothetical protein NHP190012_00910 [Helicobacter sp. NHP19-012]|uniref:Septum formation initiator n=1 Tax=Helicobacter gastrofelis TaxID=2849642 RepID=A0ABM7SJY1_9HELI|nr:MULTISPECIES: hypothetical protein [unclassified Helicobacter]BCZ18449.1 hypothetical protein NHP190012_00910 [Helicobacter sp. NHP19-012]GMB95727.1 hypothetical protein NHP22001_03160 [Helicobacter sp. NHP22-001]